MEMPDPRLQAAVDANRADLLLFHTGDSISPARWRGGEPSALEAASMVVTLDRFGFAAEAGEVLRARPWRPPGGDSGRLRNWEAHAGALWAIAEHHRLTGDAALLGELIPAVREGVRFLLGHHVVANLPYEDGFWFVRALVDGAWLLRLAGDAPSAEEAETSGRPAARCHHRLARTGRRPPRPSGHARRPGPGLRRRHDRLARGLRSARSPSARGPVGERARWTSCGSASA